MPTPTMTYSLSKPTVGGDDNAWGTEINNNLDKLDDLLDGTLPITPDLGAGWEVGGVAVTASAAELNVLDGVTASTAEINILDGVTATAADLNLTADATIAALAAYNTNGILTQTAADTFTGRTITGTTNQITVTNGNGVSGNPTVAAVVASQAEAEAGTNTTKLMTPQRTAQAVAYLRSRVLLQSIVLSNQATANFTNFDNSRFRYNEFEFESVRPVSDGTGISARLSVDGGANWLSGASDYRTALNSDLVTRITNAGLSRIYVAQVMGNELDEAFTGTAKLYHAGQSERTYLHTEGTMGSTSGAIDFSRANGFRLAAEIHNAIQFFYGTGNLSAGTIRHYGLV
jgi:hypothetical protein